MIKDLEKILSEWTLSAITSVLIEECSPTDTLISDFGL